ncbi:serine protease inhibitor ecotin [Paracoccus aminophilus]|uniref:Ecotin n=1 Tax=Paracoccus aminophilus JCM 7686 TaxID=1367847 RepID=S5XT79_PARAH|nr:serine protease inhibitor ecotin [Paracoccus aminophilus]AGT08367.1 ecotin [Paracoccus aminophilus JCM 7686]
MSIAPIGIAAASLLALSAPAFAQSAATDLKAFPAAEAGMVRHVITLPAKQNEEDLRVEILPGKMLEVDCNRVMIAAKAETKTVDGWGYDYLTIGKVSPPATTLMACPDNAKTERFVTANIGAESLRRYNSKLPLVIYAPEDLVVKYRIWRADSELSEATSE